MSKKRTTKNRIPHIRVYFSAVEWAKLQDVAAGNNMSESTCFKKAGMQTINNVIHEVMKRMDAAEMARQEKQDASTDTQAESIDTAEAVPASEPSEIPSEADEEQASS